MAHENPNVVEQFANSNNFRSAMPVTIDNSRQQPYMQYPVVRQGQSVLASGADGKQLPAKYNVDTTGPVLSLCFTPLSATVNNVTPSEFYDHVFRPALSCFPNADDSFLRYLEWDSEDAEVSLWDTTRPLDAKYINMVQGQEYVITTKPITAREFTALTAGTVKFSL